MVDEQDRVIGQETREEVHRKHLLHRAVHVLVFDSEGRVYAQRRSMQKDTYPGRYTTSCSGHVDAGETYDTAVVRELVEELGITVPGVGALELLFNHGPCRETGWEFIQVYGLVWTGVVTADPDEVMEGKWVSPDELDAWMARAPADFAPSFCLVWKRYRSQRPA